MRSTLVSDYDPCIECLKLLLVWNVGRSSEVYTKSASYNEYANVRETHAATEHQSNRKTEHSAGHMTLLCKA